MISHNENDQIHKEAKIVDFTLVLACSFWTLNISVFKCQDLGEKIYASRINNI